VEAGGVTDEDQPVDWIARAGTRAKGQRPQYFADPAQDRMLSILMALVSEVSVVRERLDTIERLLDIKGTISRTDIETYTPDKDAAYERSVSTKAYIARVMRALQQELEAMQADDAPIADVVQQLSDM
jgi:predicted  nucleic acid-binding Zn-ribbon protein